MHPQTVELARGANYGSGTTLEAQARYAAGVRESLMNFIQDRPIRDDYVTVSDGEIQSGSYKAIYS